MPASPCPSLALRGNEPSSLGPTCPFIPLHFLAGVVLLQCREWLPTDSLTSAEGKVHVAELLSYSVLCPCLEQSQHIVGSQ